MTRSSFGKRNLMGAAIVLGSLIYSFTFPLVSAAQNGGIGGRPANPDPSNSRTKSIFIHELSPGESADDQLLLINNTDETKQVLVYAVDAVPSSDGAFACAQAADTPKLVGKWVSFSESEVTLSSKETKKINFKITASEAAEPGEQNGCIVMQEKKDPTFQGGIGLSFRTAIRLSVLVPGEIVKELSADSISTNVTEDGVIITPAAKNTGTVSLDTAVNVSLLSLVGTKIQSQSNTFPVLRDQPTSWNFEFKRPFWGGYYRATYSLAYDDSNSGLPGVKSDQSDHKVINGPSQWLFVPPHPAALIIELIVLVGIGYLAFWLTKRLHRKRQIAGSWKKYVIKDGDQVKTLAGKFNVSWKELVAANGLKPPYDLAPGQSIIVPPDSEAHKRKR